MAANPLAIFPRLFFGHAHVQNLLFPHLRPRQAQMLMAAIGINLPRHGYMPCNLECESEKAPDALPAIPPPWPTANIIPAQPPPTGGGMAVNSQHQPPGINGTRAWFANAATADAAHPLGYNEPSMCIEAHNVPAAGTHA